MKTLQTIATAAALFAACTVSAKGLLGEKYFGASYDVGSVENIDLWGVSFGYNRQLGADNNYAYDLAIGVSYAEFEEFDVTVDGKDIAAGIVVYPVKNMEFKPFIGVSAGYGEASALGYSDNSFKYQVTIGGEWQASDKFTISPYWSYFDYTSLDGGDDAVIGIQASLWLNDDYNVGVDFSRMSDSGYDLDVVSFIFRKSF